MARVFLLFKLGDDRLQHRMEQIKMFLGFYVDPVPRRSWISCSLKTAKAYQTGPATAKSLQHWTQAFIADLHALPYTAVRP